MRATDKPFNIDKKLVYEAYKAVKSNGGAAGVDGQTIEQFESDGHKVRAGRFLERLAAEHRSLFVHWDIGMTGVFA